MSVNWGLGAPVADLGQTVDRTFQQFNQMQQKAQMQGAMRALAGNPNDTDALGTLMAINPEAGLRFQEFGLRRQQMDQKQQAALLQQRAAAGDPTALAQLSGIDLDAWGKLNDIDKGKIKQRTEFIGNAAQRILSMPVAQRREAFDQYIEYGIANGMPDLAQYRGQYSEQLLHGALASANMVGKFLDSQKVNYVPIGEGGLFAFNNGTGAPIGNGNPIAASQSGPPAAAVAHLRANPNLAGEFDKKYGPGSAVRALGQGGPSPSGSATFP